MLLLDQVEQTARGADDDVDAGLERLDLRLVRPAAVDGQDPRAELAGRGDQVFGDLDGQLAGRHDDQPAWLLTVLTRFADALQHRDAERVGLSRACARLTDDVLAAQRERECHLLDGERCG